VSIKIFSNSFALAMPETMRCGVVGALFVVEPLEISNDLLKFGPQCRFIVIKSRNYVAHAATRSEVGQPPGAIKRVDILLDADPEPFAHHRNAPFIGTQQTRLQSHPLAAAALP
jgi:hypothetical protein